MLTDTPAPGVLPIALLGADALLAARPATPVQVLHACVAAGFAAAYPVSWGDELVARECLSRIATSGARRVLLCDCPHAARALLEHDLPGETIALASPPVAAAKLVRGAYHGQPIRITYVGGCPSGADPAIDAHVTPSAFLATLDERGIALADQPDAFESVLPPDRRRFVSMPGGCPDAEHLREAGYELIDWRPGTACEVPDDASVMIDLASASGCVCAGAPRGRDEVVALEPPRAPHAIIDPITAVDMRPGPAIEAALLARRSAAASVAPPQARAAGDVQPSLSPGQEYVEMASPAAAGASVAHAEPRAARFGSAEPTPLERVKDVPDGEDSSQPEPIAEDWCETARDAEVPGETEPDAEISDYVASGAEPSSHAAPEVEPPVESAGGPPDEQLPPSMPRQMPGPRGFSMPNAPLRPVREFHGPVKEFRRPVFPRSDVVFEEVPQKRRFTVATLLLAVALGAAIPLAAVGGWVLLSGGPNFIVTGAPPASFEDTAGSEGQLPPQSPRPVDSAAGVTVTDSAASADSGAAGSTVSHVLPESTTVARPDSSRTAPPEPKAERRPDSSRTAALPDSLRAAPRPAPPKRVSRREGGAVRTPPARPADTLSAMRRQIRAAIDSALHAPKQTSPAELDSLVKEIARRRARVDSLTRLVDSLRQRTRGVKPPG